MGIRFCPIPAGCGGMSLLALCEQDEKTEDKIKDSLSKNFVFACVRAGHTSARYHMFAPTLTRADPRELSSDELMHFVTYMEKVYLIFLAPDHFRAEVESVRNTRSLSLAQDFRESRQQHHQGRRTRRLLLYCRQGQPPTRRAPNARVMTTARLNREISITLATTKRSWARARREEGVCRAGGTQPHGSGI